MIWLSAICLVLLIILVFFIIKFALMKKDLNAIGNEFAEKLKSDTNTLITVSSNDKSICGLVTGINAQLKILRKQRLKYEQGDAELKNTIANISHDLRTPLTAIDGYLDLLETESKSADVERYVGIIKNRTNALKQFAEELFRYSIIVSHDYDAPKERIAVNTVLEECIANYYAAFRQAGITPEIQLPDSTVYCTANRMALTRIFSNIIGNAVKYSDGDFCVLLTKDKVNFSNTASNLSAIQVERLFDRFYTVESAREIHRIRFIYCQSVGGTNGRFDCKKI